MSRYRAKRPFATSSLTAPFLRRVATLPDKIVTGQFPFTALAEERRAAEVPDAAGTP